MNSQFLFKIKIKSLKIRGNSVTKSTTTKKCLSISNTQSVRLRYAKLSRLASLKKSDIVDSTVYRHEVLVQLMLA